jgi:hypothetical protein
MAWRSAQGFTRKTIQLFLGFGISTRDWIDFLSRLRRYRKSAMGVALQGKQIKRFAFIVFSFAPKLKQAWLIRK